MSHLRGLLKPAPTSPTDQFRWTDKRPIRAQVTSGFRTAAGLIAGYAVMLVCLGGWAVVSDHDTARSGRAIATAWGALAFAATVMFWTANRWARFVTGFIFGPAVPKIVGVLAFGTDSYYSTHSISRVEVAEFLAYAVAVVALTVRFVGKHPPPTTLLDRFALTFFVFATFRQVVIPYRFPPWSLLLGALGLLIAWSVHRIHRPPRRKHLSRQHHRLTQASV